ncbi:MAG: hypothetical protein A2Y41_02030 [Spirochaetes bacterium GWB1_36_13]|nr:MAG: hypothetical protein A2Y41_02030 [Spirochaetes bacterium GWB1_36_13]
MLKKILLGTFLVSLLSTSLILMADDQSLTGKEIVVLAKNSNHLDKSIVWAKMTVLDKGKEIESRMIIQKTIYINGKQKMLARFMDGLKRNVTSLSVEREENEDNLQYVFVPGVGRPRQVDASEKQNEFEDTDFSYEEMGSAKIEDYQYKREKDEKIKISGEEFDCYFITALHKNSEAKFPKKKIWIDKKTMIPVQMKIYGKDQKLKKIMVSLKIKEVKKGIFTPQFIYIKNMESNHETKNILTKIVIDSSDIKESDFTQQNMAKPWKEN